MAAQAARRHAGQQVGDPLGHRRGPEAQERRRIGARADRQLMVSTRALEWRLPGAAPRVVGSSLRPAHQGRPQRQSTRSSLVLWITSLASLGQTTRSTFCLALPVPTLTAGLPDLRCLTRTTLAFRQPPGYGSGGWGWYAKRQGAPRPVALDAADGQTPLPGGMTVTSSSAHDTWRGR
jgi:hypothetical protein